MEEIRVGAAAFRELKNPYTGEPLVVMMRCGGSSEPLFRALPTYTTDDLYPSIPAALEAWARKDGISYVVPGGETPVCRYTGKELSFGQEDGQFYLAGGFNPCRYWPHDEFLYYATMRNGKSLYAKPHPVQRVTRPPRESEKSRTKTDDRKERASSCVEQAALDTGVSIADKFCDKSPVVSMYSRKRRRTT